MIAYAYLNSALGQLMGTVPTGFLRRTSDCPLVHRGKAAEGIIKVPSWCPLLRTFTVL